MGKETKITVRDLNLYYGENHALKDVNMNIRENCVTAFIGPSGCGKSTLGRTILKLIEPTSGEILYHGVNIESCSASKMRDMRRKMQIIFQDPYASLDPRKSVKDLIADPLKVYGVSKAEREDIVFEIMKTVGIAERFAQSYPHELDGGRRQRIGIARALVLNPEFIVCDEPISALDVSIQAQVVNLLIELQQKKNLTYLFIAHDLSMVKHISDRVGVMYLGNMVEFAESDELYQNPLHPYTKALMAAIPIPDPDTEEQKKRIRLEGEIPSPVNPKPGCRFVTRCRYATEKCHQETPQLEELKPEHFVACHRAKELMEDHPQE